MNNFSFKEWRVFLKDIGLSYYSPEVDPYLFVSFADSDLSKYLYSLSVQGKEKWSIEDLELLLTLYAKKQPHSFNNPQVLDSCIESFSHSVYQNAIIEFY